MIISGYDIIGDVHGHAEKLKYLLAKMGYSINSHGYFSHSNREAIFVGDFIDRHHKQKEVLDIVRPMIDSGSAKSVMGNHEFNAICFATKHPKGDHVRFHTDKNKYQHKAFLDEFPYGADEYKEQIDWFKTLPVFLDLGEISIIHACWCPESIDKIDLYLNEDNKLKEKAYIDYAKKGTEYYKAIETLLKGPEHHLPKGLSFFDFNGTERKKARVSWWEDHSLSTIERLVECNIEGLNNEQINNLLVMN